MPPPMPRHEAQRLHTLHLYTRLDTLTDHTLHSLTRLAAHICDTPISLISLIDANRQWFASRVGLNTTETSRDVSFCTHTILEDQLFVVEDATQDARFADNPLVLGEPRVRFYAGAPLVVRGGHALGALCVINHQPRVLTDVQRDALMTLRGAVVAQLELKRARAELQIAERLLPMCAWCRAVRAEDGSWHALDEYIMRSQPVTHGICPCCADKLYEA